MHMVWVCRTRRKCSIEIKCSLSLLMRQPKSHLTPCMARSKAVVTIHNAAAPAPATVHRPFRLRQHLAIHVIDTPCKHENLISTKRDCGECKCTVCNMVSIWRLPVYSMPSVWLYTLRSKAVITSATVLHQYKSRNTISCSEAEPSVTCGQVTY
eukprot:jgi/Ulvmu1/5198/UM021_0215.1